MSVLIVIGYKSFSVGFSDWIGIIYQEFDSHIKINQKYLQQFAYHFQLQKGYVDLRFHRTL